mmetsp:Transcript_11741/g.24800  ORF Transcript_11741/g.24800 Transcript_11741/m.24800 type:complete len:309 (+) Transcript_11741:356-1282(+)
MNKLPWETSKEKNQKPILNLLLRDASPEETPASRCSTPRAINFIHNEGVQTIAEGLGQNLEGTWIALATNKSLKQAFYHSQEAVRVEEISKDVERYVLLPRKSEDDPYHDVPIFYTHPVPANTPDRDADNLLLEDARKFLPKLPRFFTGREVDMCKILDALRVENIIRIGGIRGMGKSSLAAAVCRYVQMRSASFEFDDVFWLPAARGVVPEEDTLFAEPFEHTGLVVKTDGNASKSKRLYSFDWIGLDWIGWEWNGMANTPEVQIDSIENPEGSIAQNGRQGWTMPSQTRTLFGDWISSTLGRSTVV